MDAAMAQHQATTALPNPYVTINVRWVGKWMGFMREDPDTLLVHWRLVQADDPVGTEVTGVADDGLAAFTQLKQAHDRAIAKEKIHASSSTPVG